MVFSKKDTLAIKGIAILLLLHYHNFFQSSRFVNYNVDLSPFSESTMLLLTSFFKICVAIFAFLSAYGLTLSLKKYNSNSCLTGEQYKSYLGQRLLKLMWGYWFVFLISLIAVSVLKPERSFPTYFTGNGIESIVQGIFKMLLDFLGLTFLSDTPSMNGTWWYMGLAIFIVIVVPFITMLYKKWGVLLVLLACFIVPRMIFPAENFEVGEYNNLFKWMLVVILGSVFAQYDILVRMKAFKITKNKYLSKTLKFLISTVIMAAFYIAYVMLNGKNRNYTYEFRDNIVPVFFIYYCYDFIVDIPVVRQFLIFIGKHSMNIFFIHNFYRQILFGSFIYSFKHWLLIDLVLLITSLATSIFIELIKKLLRYDKLLLLILNRMENKNAVAEK